MTLDDRELGQISQRLADIERRLEEGEDDIKALTRSNGELTAAIAGLTSRIAALPAASLTGGVSDRMVEALDRISARLAAPPATPPGAASGGPNPATVAGVAGSAGAAIGTAFGAKLAAMFGFGP